MNAARLPTYDRRHAGASRELVATVRRSRVPGYLTSERGLAHPSRENAARGQAVTRGRGHSILDVENFVEVRHLKQFSRLRSRGSQQEASVVARRTLVSANQEVETLRVQERDAREVDRNWFVGVQQWYQRLPQLRSRPRRRALTAFSRNHDVSRTLWR